MVVQTIRGIFGDKTLGRFDLLDRDDIRKAERQILKTVFDHTRSKTSIVVPKFQKVRKGNISEENRVFYDDDAKKIYLKPEAFEFFNSSYWMLSKFVLLE